MQPPSNGTSAEQDLCTLMARANRDGTARISPKDTPRTIRWEIDGQSYFWNTDGSGVAWAGPGRVDCTLRCSPEVLGRLARRELPFFLALWATGDVHFEGDFADAFRLGYLFLGDKRTRRIVFLAHCFLNMNTRFPEGADFAGANIPLVEILLESEVGIVQMPCPEFLCLGIEKTGWAAGTPAEIRGAFRRVAETVADQVGAYQGHGYEILGIIGMNPSPSCGVEASKGKGTMLGLDRDTSERAEPGVFIEELIALLEERGLSRPPVFGVRRTLPGEGGLEKQLQQVRERLQRHRAGANQTDAE
jgi:predicted secreted protein